MQSTNITTDQLDLIKRFLRVRGWVLIDHPNKNLLVYEGFYDDFHRPLRLALPAASHFVDGNHMIIKAIQALSALEQRPVQEINEEIAALGSDTDPLPESVAKTLRTWRELEEL